MSAGKYRERITVQEKSGAPDAAGVVTAWGEYCSRRAAVVALAGREGVRARSINATVDYLVTLRADAITEAITPRMQVIWNGKALKIESALLKGREVELSCGSRA